MSKKRQRRTVRKTTAKERQAGRERKHKFDEPVCCNLAGLAAYWDGRRWLFNQEGPYELEIFYCPFCGEALRATTPGWDMVTGLKHNHDQGG